MKHYKLRTGKGELKSDLDAERLPKNDAATK